MRCVALLVNQRKEKKSNYQQCIHPTTEVTKDLYYDLEHTGWICSNPARTRTKVPCEAKVPTVGQIVRSGAIPVHLTALRQLIAQYNLRAIELSLVYSVQSVCGFRASGCFRWFRPHPKPSHCVEFYELVD